MNNKSTRKIKYVGNRKFILLDTLQYDVRQGRSGDVVFPAGTKNVWVSFRTGWNYRVPRTDNVIKLNVYMKNGIMAHA